MQEVKDEQMRISLHHKNLTLEIALVVYRRSVFSGKVLFVEKRTHEKKS